MKHLALAVLLLSSTACGGGTKPAPSSPSPSSSTAGTLKELQNGDRACYVVVTTEAGDQSLEGAFELCPGGERDASAMIGQRVTWTTEKGNVLAADCEGDVDCGRSDEVDLITTITAAP